MLRSLEAEQFTRKIWCRKKVGSRAEQGVRDCAANRRFAAQSKAIMLKVCVSVIGQKGIDEVVQCVAVRSISPNNLNGERREH